MHHALSLPAEVERTNGGRGRGRPGNGLGSRDLRQWTAAAAAHDDESHSSSPANDCNFGNNVVLEGRQIADDSGGLDKEGPFLSTFIACDGDDSRPSRTHPSALRRQPVRCSVGWVPLALFSGKICPNPFL